MKKRSKKGFTIVELVIVIAVIAILAAVLIPTFAGVVRKSRLSADKQTVRQMNVALATGDGVDTYTEMADILIEQGYNGDQTIIPASKGHAYYWVKEYNTIVLVKDGDVIYPEDKKFDNFDVNAEGVYAFKASYYVASADSVEEAQTAISKGNSLTVETKLDAPIVISNDINVQGEIVYDLGENALVLEPSGQKSPYVNVVGAGNKITIKSGSITARGIYAKDGGEIVIEDAKIIHDDDNGGSPIRATDSKITINGGEFVVNKGDANRETVEELAYESSVLYAKNTQVVINGGKFIAEKSGAYAISVAGGSLTINGDIEVLTKRGCVSATGGAQVVINGGTYTQTANFAGGHAMWADETSSINMTAGKLVYTTVVYGNVTLAPAVIQEVYVAA